MTETITDGLGLGDLFSPAPSAVSDSVGRGGRGDVVIVNNGAPVEVENVSTDEAGRRVVEIAARDVNRGGPLARAQRARRFEHG